MSRNFVLNTAILAAIFSCFVIGTSANAQEKTKGYGVGLEDGWVYPKQAWERGVKLSPDWDYRGQPMERLTRKSLQKLDDVAENWEKTPVTFSGMRGYHDLIDGASNVKDSIIFGANGHGRQTEAEHRTLNIDFTTVRQDYSAFIALSLWNFEFVAHGTIFDFEVTDTDPSTPAFEIERDDFGDFRAATKYGFNDILEWDTLKLSAYADVRLPTGKISVGEGFFDIEAGAAMSWEMMEDTLYFLTNAAYFYQDRPNAPNIAGVNFEDVHAGLYRAGMVLKFDWYEFYGYYEGSYFDSATSRREVSDRMDGRAAGGVVFHVWYDDLQPFSVTLGGEYLVVDSAFENTPDPSNNAAEYTAFVGFTLPVWFGDNHKVVTEYE